MVDGRDLTQFDQLSRREFMTLVGRRGPLAAHATFRDHRDLLL
jgi:hypothetical protein